MISCRDNPIFFSERDLVVLRSGRRDACMKRHDSREKVLGGRDQRCLRNSSMVKPMSRAICRRRMGEMSLHGWQGTVVPLPSGWRNCSWLPFWRASIKPRRSRMVITSNGFNTARDPIVKPRQRSGFRQIPSPAPARLLQDQFNNLFEIVIQLVQGFPLRMGAPQFRNISDKKPRVGTLLNDGCIDPHVPFPFSIPSDEIPDRWA